jgi:mRNA-decapping enzyme subunit 2
MNQGESDVACAVREVWEEIGINISQYINPEEHLDYPEDSDEQRLFIVVGVQENVDFSINTRNEIGKVEWVRLNDIPSKKSRSESKYPGMHFSKVHNFLRNLRRWINKKKQEQQTVEPKPEPEVETFKTKLSEFHMNPKRLHWVLDFPHLIR